VLSRRRDGRRARSTLLGSFLLWRVARELAALASDLDTDAASLALAFALLKD
jgi:hypothetical protein